MIAITTGGAGAVTLMTLAFWAWFTYGSEAGGGNVELLKWAGRCLAIAAAAGAQVLLITFVVGRVYRLNSTHDALRLGATVIASLAIVTAAALRLAAR